MVSIKKYDLNGKETGEVEISDDLLEIQVSPQMVKDYLVALRHNQRQWSANTKGRSELSYSKKKPHPQKGTGNARQGYIGVSQYRGGAVVFGPKPKFDQNQRVNRKEKRLAIKSLLVDRIKANKVRVLDFAGMDAPRTKTIAAFLREVSLTNEKALFLAACEGDFVALSKSIRNLPKASFRRMTGVNGYDLALNQEIIVLQSALDEFKAALGERK